MTRQSIHDRILSRNTPTNAENAERLGAVARNWPKKAIFSALSVAILGLGGYLAVYSDKMEGLFSQVGVAETTLPKGDQLDTPFLQHAKQAGLQTCSSLFPALGNLLTNGSQYSVQSVWNTKAPNEHAVQAFVGMDYASESYKGSAAGIVFAAPSGSACEGAMIRVAPFATSCGNIPSLLPQGSVLANTLGQVAVYSLANNNGSAMLLPSGNSCVVISVASASK
ncbi:hypothetical protein [Brucella intermedia]|uniref:hypothetical protein n=1 Tax=Brucella intermedia TaxID=94625 RepID=UPI00235FA0C6|nr:hypothetical protein [Brucella intermedia]